MIEFTIKVSDLIKLLRDIEDYDIFKVWDPFSDGSCPCFDGGMKTDKGLIFVEGRCWRVSENAQDLYVWGTIPKKELKIIAEQTKRALDATEWHSPYTIIYKKPSWVDDTVEQELLKETVGNVE